MYTFNVTRRSELIEVFKTALTEKEKKLLYSACIVTAQEIERAEKRFETMVKPSNDFSAKAGELYELALILAESMEEKEL